MGTKFTAIMHSFQGPCGIFKRYCANDLSLGRVHQVDISQWDVFSIFCIIYILKVHIRKAKGGRAKGKDLMVESLGARALLGPGGWQRPR